jgi:hypothetical protein
VTFWTAVGAIGTCAAIFIGIQEGGRAEPATTTLPTATFDSPDGERVRESSDIATVRASDYIYDDTCSCVEVEPIPTGAKIRLLCVAQGATFTKDGRSSESWYQVEGGYVPDAVVSTSSQFSPELC